MPEDEERMDVEEQLAALNEALRLQARSPLQYTLTAGTIFGFEYQGLALALANFAEAELEDVRRLVEKVAAVGGEPTVEVAPLRYEKDPKKAVDWLIEAETETLEALQGAIEPTGREAASEAIEHRLEHIIMRKQEQVDVLLRVRRT